jgi:hypothetical protein
MILLAALRNSFKVRDTPSNTRYHRISLTRKNRRNHRGTPTVHPESGERPTEDVLEKARRRVAREKKRLATKENGLTPANKKKVSQLLARPLFDWTFPNSPSSPQTIHLPNGHENELFLEVIHDSVGHTSNVTDKDKDNCEDEYAN